MENTDRANLEAINQETRDIWNQNAAFWDEKMGEGNQFQLALVGPASERLLELQGGESVLDVACGNGVFARRLAQLGAWVVACDFSEVFIERARERASEHGDRIEYRVIDATDESQLLALGERRFDAVVCNMALMDMVTIDPLLRALGRILKEGGKFVFSVQHPCFNNNEIRMAVEEEDRDGQLITAYYIKTGNYLRVPPGKGLGMIGQPAPHYYYHRPIGVLFNACFSAGFMLDSMEEPALGEGEDAQWPFSWANYKNIPPILVARMRLLGRP